MQTSFIARTISRIRRATDEPSINAKYDDDDLLDEISTAYSTILGELNRQIEEPITAFVDITTDGDTDAFHLPPTVGSIVGITMVDSAGRYQGHTAPASRFNAFGRDWKIMGNTFFCDAGSIGKGNIFRVEFEPSGTASLFSGNITAAVDITTDSDGRHVITLPSSPSVGQLDTRNNAYAGSLLRVLGDTGAGAQDYVQECPIRSYVNTTRKATLLVNLSPVPAGGTSTTIETAPILDNVLDALVAKHVARGILSNEGDNRRWKSVNQEYLELMRAARLRFANFFKFKAGRKDSDGYANRTHIGYEKIIF